MKIKQEIKWAAASYLVTFATLIVMLTCNEIANVSPHNVLANFAAFMITQFYPLIAVVIIVLPYSIFTKRWYAFHWACVGNIAFFPLTLIFIIFLSFVVGGPISAWQEGWYVVAVALVIAYLTLATLVIKRWIMKRKSQPPPAGDVGSRAAPKE